MKRIALLLVLGMSIGCSSDEPPVTEPPIRDAVERVEILEEPVLTPDAFIIQDEAALIDVEVFEDRLVFVYDGVPVAYPGVGNVVTGIQGGGFIRRLLTADLDGNRLSADTEHAYLEDFFDELAFVSSYSPAPDFVTDDLGRRVDALGAGLTFPSIDVGEDCGLGGGANIDLNVDMSPRFDLEIDIGDRYFKTAVGGTVGADISASVGGVSFDCEWTLPAERRPSREWTQTFFVPVGFIPVPVIITHEIFLTAKLTASASATAGTVTGSAGGDLSFLVGAEYRDGWNKIQEGDSAGRAGVTATEPGTATIEARFTPGFGYLGKIYDTAGPEITLGAFIEGKAEVNFCEWSAEVNGGISATLAPKIEVPIWDRVLFEANFGFDLFSREIFSADGEFAFERCMDPDPDPDPEMGCRGTGCGAGEVCDAASGMCGTDPCTSAMCGAGEACRGGDCEASCAMVTCGAGERCSAGACEVDACAGAMCGDGEVCNPADGACVEDMCPGVTCPSAESCEPVSGECEPDACADVTCPSGEACMEGECVVDMCGGVSCGEGTECNPSSGACEDPCDGMCTEGEECVEGTCEEMPDDPCSDYSDCDSCARAPEHGGCGWCNGSCMADSRAAECGSDWRGSPSSCVECDAGSCTECARNGFCAWCPGMGCVNEAHDEFAMCGGDAARIPSQCGG